MKADLAVSGNDGTKQNVKVKFDGLRPETLGETLDNLRKRAGLSMNDLAKAMGYRGQSSIQRYLDAEYNLDLRPTLVRRFEKALAGKGNPPITEGEFRILTAPQKIIDEADTNLHSLAEYASGHTGRPLEATFPLSTGTAKLSLPPNLAKFDLAALRLWFEFILTTTELRIQEPKE